MLPTITIQIITIPQPTNLGIQNKYVHGETKARAETHTLSLSLSLRKGQAASMSLLTFVAGHCRPKVLAQPL